jgi:hypothetical protein
VKDSVNANLKYNEYRYRTLFYARESILSAWEAQVDINTCKNVQISNLKKGMIGRVSYYLGKV